MDISEHGLRVISPMTVFNMFNKYKNQPHDNRYVYWSMFYISGLVEDILNWFQQAGIENVYIGDQVFPLTKDLLFSTSIDPFSDEHEELLKDIDGPLSDIMRLRHDLDTRITFRFDPMVHIWNPEPIMNPDEIVIPQQQITLIVPDYMGHMGRYNLTSVNSEGFTRQDLLNQASWTYRNMYINDDFTGVNIASGKPKLVQDISQGINRNEFYINVI